ncbi:MAG: aldolase catalytic domain-containing protein [Verrucomicrobiae bacterium]|nr:aldolase catalytic domain-containing protein [Verrucomicrobiae bacterium]
MANDNQLRGSKGWVTYRPELKVLDCTIRDGGLMNNHQFDEKFVTAVYQACNEAGIDYMEVGYKADKKVFSTTKFGPWKFCAEDDLRKMVGEQKGGTKISVMADADRTNYHSDILPRDKSVIDLVRVATYVNQIPAAIDMIKDAHDKGYETTVNLMAVSTVQDWELDDALDALAQSPVGTLYLVDSFGSLYSEQIDALMQKYLKIAKSVGKEVGIHTHNNLQLAYSNTIEAIILGANRVDASLAGLGRGSGNCQMELLLSFLHNPKFRLRPVLQCIQEHVEPLREKLRWGFGIPYLITGYLNQHPRAAMEFMEGENHRDIVKFFDSVMEEE